MKTSIEYLGLTLKNPLIASASPFSSNIDACRRLEDNGISAIVMHSLFEEEINYELHEIDQMLFSHTDSFAEALSFFPDNEFENYETDNYLEELVKLKRSLDIPVIASLNGVSSGGWVNYAKALEKNGADALELNLYYPSDDVKHNALKIEIHYLEAIAAVKEACNLPFAIKIAPQFTSLPHFLKQAYDAGANGAVLFNRFYQPDIDLEALEWNSKLYESSTFDFAQMLRAVAMNYGKTGLQLSASGGVRSGTDIIKAVMAGAATVGAASVLYQKGTEYTSEMLKEATDWMTEREYESFDQMRGSISYTKAPNPSALERANYVKLLRHGKALWGW